MSDAAGGLRFSSLWIGVNGKVRVGRVHRETIPFEIRRVAGKPRVQQTSLRQRVKAPVPAARRFQLLLGGSDRSQRLNRRSFIRGADSFRVDTQAFGGVAGRTPSKREDGDEE